jgi:hypothetical protein
MGEELNRGSNEKLGSLIVSWLGSWTGDGWRGEGNYENEIRLDFLIFFQTNTWVVVWSEGI